MIITTKSVIRWLIFTTVSTLLLGCQTGVPYSSDIFDDQNILTANTPFRAIASTAVCLQTSCDEGPITAAEILAVSGDGMTVIYTDSPRNSIGFLDISVPAAPKGIGRMSLPGEPTSIATKGNLALVAVTTASYPDTPAGELIIVDVNTQRQLTSMVLPGQPDSIAVSPDKNFAVIAIENERSYQVNGGALPQLPPGTVVIVSTAAEEPDNWQLSTVDITGLADEFPRDPEPEYVDINSDNQAVVSLQENNHLVVIDLTTGAVLSHFSAGESTNQVPGAASGSRFDLQVRAKREPDGISWLANDYIVTADEGDYQGGTDTVTIFDKNGGVLWTSDDSVARIMRLINREDQTLRSGAQPENIEVATFTTDKTYLFANIERGDVVLVYDASDPTRPELVQVLDTPKGPEGGLAIPARNLFLVASEDDIPDEGVRSQIHIFEYTEQAQ